MNFVQKNRTAILFGVASFILLAALVLYLCIPEQADEAMNAYGDAAKTQVENVQLAKGGNQWPPVSPYAGMEVARVPLLPITQNVSAAQSMAQSRYGDERTPPIVRSKEVAELPSAEELADPKEYAKYEARQNLRVYASFIAASKQEVPRLLADIERGKAMGIEAEKIAKVEDKVRRLQAMQAQLLKEHPQLE